MKKYFNILSGVILAIGFLFFTNACTIQKRVHRKGWHISWNTHKHAGKQEKISKAETAETKDQEQHLTTVSKKSENAATVTFEPAFSEPLQTSDTYPGITKDSEQDVFASTDEYTVEEQENTPSSREIARDKEPKSRRKLFLTLGIIGIVLTAFAAFLTFVMLIVIAFEAGSIYSLVLFILLTLSLLVGTILSFKRAKAEKS